MLLVSALESFSKLVGQKERPYVLEQQFGDRPCYYAMEWQSGPSGAARINFSPVDNKDKAAGFGSRLAATLIARQLNKDMDRNSMSVQPSLVRVVTRESLANSSKRTKSSAKTPA